MQSSEGERGLRHRDGGRAQGLPPRLRRRYRSGLHGRVEQAADQGDPARRCRRAPGQPAIYDFEYERNGAANLFMVHAPLAGWRGVEVTGRRAKLDFAHLLRNMADAHVPGRKIALVMDNLNTRKLSALYKAFPADEASRLADRFEVHHTPSTEAGSTWRRPRSAFCPGSA